MMLNCTFIYVGDVVYIRAQNAVYLTLLTCGILLNIFVAIDTILSASCRRCDTARLFISSYVGNVMAMVSLAMSNVHDPQRGVPVARCVRGKDKNTLLYLGYTLATLTLTTVTCNRYYTIKSNRLYRNRKSLMLHYVIPSWATSILVTGACVAFLETGVLTPTPPLVVCVYISLLPIIACIALNFKLRQHLQYLRKTMSESIHQQNSLQNISRAISVIRLTTLGHAVFLASTAVLLVLFTLYEGHTTVYVTCDWCARVLCFFVYTNEACVYLRKNQSSLKNKLFSRMRSTKNNKSHYSTTSSTVNGQKSSEV